MQRDFTMKRATKAAVCGLALACSSVSAFVTPSNGVARAPLRTNAMARMIPTMGETRVFSFDTNVFEKTTVELSGTREDLLKGGRDLFPKIPEAFKNIKKIGVIGWGSQGPAQAMNLRDTITDCGAEISMKVGLRPGSASEAEAQAAGFETGDMYDVIKDSDLVVCLISDAACASEYKKIFAAMKPGATLGLSHGFLLGHLEAIGEAFPDNINVVLVAPKGMGPSVRRLYEQGKTTNGAGINASFAVHQDVTGDATDIALGWGIALGSPFMFKTTLTEEYKSDIYGERCVLLGAVHGIVESLFRRYTGQGMSDEDAFKNTAETISGLITPKISKDGILKVYQDLQGADKETFERAFSASYLPAKEICQEIYDEVASGNEIRSVILHGNRLGKYPIGKIDGTRTWQVGERVRAARDGSYVENAFTTGVSWPAMATIGVLFLGGPLLLGDCERVRHRGGGLAGPLHALQGRGAHGGQLLHHRPAGLQVGPGRLHPRAAGLRPVDSEVPVNQQILDDFVNNPVHTAVGVCATMRPSVDISCAAPSTVKERN
ncbi:unnamed protein product [Heterosigma akashiwo]